MLPLDVIGVMLICMNEASSWCPRRSCRNSTRSVAIAVRSTPPPTQVPQRTPRRNGTAAVDAAGAAVIGCAGVRPEDGPGPVAGQLGVAPLLIRDESVSRRK